MVAIVRKQGIPAAELRSLAEGTQFSYLPDYLRAGGPAVATTLPLSEQPVLTPPGSVPAFFAGLLPEGRRLTALRGRIKAAADDELSILVEVGSDTVGDVQILAASEEPRDAPVELPQAPSRVSFAELFEHDLSVGNVALPGVQDKISGKMISLPASLAGGQYIFRLSPPEYPHVVENEAFFLDAARACRIPTVESKLMHDRDGVAGLLVKRFDRTGADEGSRRLAAEDGCQVLGRWPADKYSLAFEEVAFGLMNVCMAPEVAALQIFRQWIFALLTGNGDQHAKNFSVVQAADAEWRVSPMYDVPCTVIYGDSTLALSALGKKDGFSRKQALELGARISLPHSIAEPALDRILQATAGLLSELDSGALPFDETRTMRALKVLRNRRSLLDA